MMQAVSNLLILCVTSVFVAAKQLSEGVGVVIPSATSSIDCERHCDILEGCMYWSYEDETGYCDVSLPHHNLVQGVRNIVTLQDECTMWKDEDCGYLVNTIYFGDCSLERDSPEQCPGKMCSDGCSFVASSCEGSCQRNLLIETKFSVGTLKLLEVQDAFIQGVKTELSLFWGIPESHLFVVSAQEDTPGIATIVIEITPWSLDMPTTNLLQIAFPILWPGFDVNLHPYISNLIAFTCLSGCVGSSDESLFGHIHPTNQLGAELYEGDDRHACQGFCLDIGGFGKLLKLHEPLRLYSCKTTETDGLSHDEDFSWNSDGSHQIVWRITEEICESLETGCPDYFNITEGNFVRCVEVVNSELFLRECKNTVDVDFYLQKFAQDSEGRIRWTDNNISPNSGLCWVVSGTADDAGPTACVNTGLCEQVDLTDCDVQAGTGGSKCHQRLNVALHDCGGDPKFNTWTLGSAPIVPGVWCS